ncbi:MAG: 6,7-dimethyl-8-ribityllumazine synthase [Bacteroidales bacterium]|jgi:6,7-dimethyl-8-ribityllumazine synthase|nr:6,7-dimethyl-8-ribityllumazine synthase [Bacteroidales bacterium]
MASNLKNLSEYNESGIATNNNKNNYKIGIVVSEWNEQITANLAEAAIETLKKYNFSAEDIILKSVCGSFELPLGAKFLIEGREKVDAVICLGCVIQGETRHFDFICEAVSQGIMKLNLKYSIPVSFGLLTTNNLQQAIDRSGGKYGNKGDEATIAVLKMLYLKNELL